MGLSDFPQAGVSFWKYWDNCFTTRAHFIKVISDTMPDIGKTSTKPIYLGTNKAPRDVVPEFRSIKLSSWVDDEKPAQWSRLSETVGMCPALANRYFQTITEPQLSETWQNLLNSQPAFFPWSSTSF
eukprot:Blabericola_migrator_1__11616@NODE_698_length_6826_cov_185_661340_g507_i0_p6_GENE_NODE_698_length_6826_cov_185_661340_g507_i0NODE_698_length_6826_cov_185_661340_g507_i0_p6_ORF_typecomplete_len127_score7_30LPD22/PF18834_1/0_02Npa1/PF11707_8/0_092_NODE_698_length_6826_cov_185_661340_g507_i016322012